MTSLKETKIRENIQDWRVSRGESTYSIPNMKLDLLAVEGDHTSTKFNTNCRIMMRVESLIFELLEKAGLADT